MYLITFDYSATVYVLHIYRCIFSIWIHYFKFFAYVCLTWCCIFWCCRCLVLPDVASSGVAGVGLLLLIFLSQMFLVDSLQHCISYCLTNSYFVFSYDIRCISITCMHISIYMLVCENDIFIDIFNISFNFLHISQWIFSHKCIVYKVFK